VSFGALAVTAGLSPAKALGMSLLVFTGASQFAFIGVLANGGSVVAAIVPALLLAGRNGLYGLSLAPLLHGRLPVRALEAHLVIDESTAMARAQRTPRSAHRAFLETGLSVLVCWNVGTIAGAEFGKAIGDPHRLGLDAMFPAAFLFLLAPQLRRAGGKASALGGAAIAVTLVSFVSPGVPILASCLGILPAAFVLGRVRRRRSGGGGAGAHGAGETA
jgi:4-azaleucine resistance transporter AzlC